MKFSSTALLPLLALPLASAFPFSLVSKRANLTSSTQNDIVNNVACKQVTIIWARGTGNPGNVGELQGPPFFQAVAAAIGANNLAMQGVDYAANVFGFLGGGDSAGSTKFKQLIETTITQCPNTKITISGHSQGAQLVHNAALQLSAASTAKISSAITFGDPFNGSLVGTVSPARVKIYCHVGDNICEGGIIIRPQHSTYGQLDSADAAAFVKANAGL